MIRIMLILAVSLSAPTAYAQIDLMAIARLGVGYGGELDIVNSSPSNNTTFNSRLGVNVAFPLFSVLRLEVGTGGTLFMGAASLRGVEYNYRILRLDTEVQLVAKSNNKWAYGVGLNISTHRDFEGLLIQRDDNIRWNGLLSIHYRYNQKWSYTVVTIGSLNYLGDSYYIGTPRYSTCIGVRYHL